MNPREDFSFPARFLITLIIVLAILFALALFGYLGGRWEDASAQPAPLPPSKYDQRMKEITREAAENALRNRIEQLFETWMKDPTGQPQRAQTGARNARAAFIAVMEANE